MRHNERNGSHRLRAKTGHKNSEVRIGPDEYHRLVRETISQGYVIEIDDNARPAIREPQPLKDTEWGFMASLLRQDAIKISWADQELITMLEWGLYEYSSATPPICSFSPHQLKAMMQKESFMALTRKEIENGWIVGATAWPPSIPFAVIPGSIEPKRQEGRWRLVWKRKQPKRGRRGREREHRWRRMAASVCEQQHQPTRRTEA